MKNKIRDLALSLVTSLLVTFFSYLIISIMGASFNPYQWHPATKWIGGTALVVIFIGVFVFYTKLLKKNEPEK